MIHSLPLAPKFWLMAALVGVAALCLITVLAGGAFLLRQAGQEKDFSSRLALLILLGFLFFNLSLGFAYIFNQTRKTASFRTTPSGISWINWNQKHRHLWQEVKSLTLKTSNKGWDILEIRCRKNAVESETFEIDSTEVRNFPNLVAALEKSTGLSARRVQ